jgi:hypothetical protein
MSPHDLITPDISRWIERTIFVFFVLYALFGIREVRRHLPTAWAALTNEWHQREFGKLVTIGLYGLLVTFGPLYIALEVLERTLRATSS